MSLTEAGRAPVIIFLYNRLFDPLIQSNFWLYMQDYLRDQDRNVDIHLITYEDARYPLSAEQRALVEDWMCQGLFWHPLTYHPGMGARPKLIDIFAGLRKVRKLKKDFGAHRIATLGSVAGTFAYLYTLLTGLKLFLYQYEPHSEVSRDAGAWKVNSWQYQISRFLERASAKRADVIASGTRFMGEFLQNELNFAGTFVRIPTVANDRKFAFDASRRAAKRAELNIAPEDRLIFYPGKFGGLYYNTEIGEVVAQMMVHDPKLKFLVVTPNDPVDVRNMLQRSGIPAEALTIAQSGYEGIEDYFFAGDLGLITIPPGPAQKYRSSIKVGEYLCAGLPFLTSTGISEDYVYATERNVGVVVESFSRDEIDRVWPEIDRFLSEDKQTLRTRCREVGVEYRGFDAQNPKFKHAMQALVEA